MAVACFDVRVVILVVGHEAHGIDEAQGAVEILELEILDDGLAVLAQLPARQCAQELGGFLGSERVLLALARLAVLVRQFGGVHRKAPCRFEVRREGSKLAREKSKRMATPAIGLETGLKWC